MHVVLLGDSIFDNAPYTSGEPDVVTHLRDLLPRGWTATLVAVDGSRIADVEAQLRRVPRDATHLVVSAGGNDALMNADVLEIPVRSTAEALAIFGERVAGFEADYRKAVQATLRLGLPTTVCTIYNGNLEPERAAGARTALALFDDAIVRTAIELRVDLLELRLVCTTARHYANPIEPSGEGGRRIAEAIRRHVVDAGAAARAGY